MRLHLIDGTFELFRAHYAPRPSRTAPDGQDVKATVGVAGSLLRLIDDPDERATHLAVAFDNPVESFRNRLFDGYKTGEGMDPALAAQFDLVEEVTKALGIVVWSMDEYEADDALATAARRWRDDVDQVRILTPDKDLGQCVTGARVVQVDRIRRRVIDEDGVRERNGVAPASIPDWLALVGDTADGIPGVPGFGAKTAAALLSHYGTVDAIPADPSTWAVRVRGAARLADALNTMRDEASLYRRLAVLVEDVPLAESLADLRWKGGERAAVEAVSTRLGGLDVVPTRWR
ncbi:MAG: flap endonuclease [Gammaproteobacteria bacterium]|nr:flap endonuclease [Gammaproteobacteria bacterium]